MPVKAVPQGRQYRIIGIFCRRSTRVINGERASLNLTLIVQSTQEVRATVERPSALPCDSFLALDYRSGWGGEHLAQQLAGADGLEVWRW